MEVVAELLVRVAHITQKALLEQAKAASQPQPQPPSHTPWQSQAQGATDHNEAVKQEPRARRDAGSGALGQLPSRDLGRGRGRERSRGCWCWCSGAAGETAAPLRLDGSAGEERGGAGAAGGCAGICFGTAYAWVWALQVLYGK